MATDNEDLTISITGGDAQARGLVANVTAEALEDQGFTDVRLLNHAGETIPKGDVDTLLDLIQEARPDIFEKPISIETHVPVGEEEYLITSDDVPDEDGLSTDEEALADQMLND